VKFIKDTVWDFVLSMLSFAVGAVFFTVEELAWPFVVFIVFFVVIKIATYFKWHHKKVSE